MPLSGSVVLITGATGPVGRAVADAFFKANARVALSVRRIEDVHPAELNLRQSGWRPFIAPCDVRFEEDVIRLVHRVIRHFARIDMLVSAATIDGPEERIMDCPVEPWRKLIATNLTGPYLLCREVLPWMLRQHRGAIRFLQRPLSEAPAAGLGPARVIQQALDALVHEMQAEIRQPDVSVQTLTISEGAPSTWVEALIKLALDQARPPAPSV